MREDGWIKRLKRYFEEERQKLQGYSFKEKIKYIFDYYWLWMLGIAVVLFFGGDLLWHGLLAPGDNWMYLMIANTRQEVGNHTQLWDDFADYAELNLDEKNLEFNVNCYFDPGTSSGRRSTYYQTFVSFADAGILDAVTMQKEDLITLGSGGRLKDLENEDCQRLLEKYQDRLVYTVPAEQNYGKDLVPVGIDLSDSILMTKYQIYPDSCVLGIGAHAKHLDIVEEFLSYVLEEA